MQWDKLGRILQPRQDSSWLATAAGPSFAMVEGNKLRLYVTGRDTENRSRIGIVHFDMPTLTVDAIEPEPVLSLGGKGSFDQNGTGYPFIVESEDHIWMFYVGWTPSVLVPFQNDIGLARSKDGRSFQRVSRAPIVPRTDADHLSLGSVSVMKDEGLWKMWYTTFESWGTEPADPKHYYHIKYAHSVNGIDWVRENRVAVTYEGADEYVLGRPCVIKFQGQYHMWYCRRGSAYRLGYAHSDTGVEFKRRDDQLIGLDWSENGWDSEMVCYPYCFFWNDNLYMLYNGNGYGRTGLGLAKLRNISDLRKPL